MFHSFYQSAHTEDLQCARFFFLGIKYLEANKTDTTLRFYSAFSIWSLDDGGSGTRVVNRKQISNCIKYVFHDD